LIIKTKLALSQMQPQIRILPHHKVLHSALTTTDSTVMLPLNANHGTETMHAACSPNHKLKLLLRLIPPLQSMLMTKLEQHTLATANH
jgi:hypothetical protein